jgi:hypothetical protein
MSEAALTTCMTLCEPYSFAETSEMPHEVKILWSAGEQRSPKPSRKALVADGRACQHHLRRGEALRANMGGGKESHRVPAPASGA